MTEIRLPGLITTVRAAQPCNVEKNITECKSKFNEILQASSEGGRSAVQAMAGRLSTETGLSGLIDVKASEVEGVYQVSFDLWRDPDSTHYTASTSVFIHDEEPEP